MRDVVRVLLLVLAGERVLPQHVRPDPEALVPVLQRLRDRHAPGTRRSPAAA